MIMHNATPSMIVFRAYGNNFRKIRTPLIFNIKLPTIIFHAVTEKLSTVFNFL